MVVFPFIFLGFFGGLHGLLLISGGFRADTKYHAGWNQLGKVHFGGETNEYKRWKEILGRYGKRRKKANETDKQIAKVLWDAGRSTEEVRNLIEKTRVAIKDKKGKVIGWDIILSDEEKFRIDLPKKQKPSPTKK